MGDTDTQPKKRRGRTPLPGLNPTPETTRREQPLENSNPKRFRGINQHGGGATPMTAAAIKRRPRVGEISPGRVSSEEVYFELSPKAQALRRRAIAGGMPPETADEMIARVQRARAEMDRYLVPKSIADTPNGGWPTAERFQHVHDPHALAAQVIGFREEYSPDNRGTIPDARAPIMRPVTIARPMTLSGARDELIHISHLATGAGPDDFRRTLTPLDRAAETTECQALERFVMATLLRDGKIRVADYSGQPRGSDGVSAGPLSPWELDMVNSRKFAFAKLSPASQREALLFYALMVNDPDREEGDEHIFSLLDLGKEIACTTDDRVAKGAYIATIRKLGQQFYLHFVEWEVNRTRERLAAAEQKKLRRA